jgi:hypothetical protein
MTDAQTAARVRSGPLYVVEGRGRWPWNRWRFGDKTEVRALADTALTETLVSWPRARIRQILHGQSVVIREVRR